MTTSSSPRATSAVDPGRGTSGGPAGRRSRRSRGPRTRSRRRTPRRRAASRPRTKPTPAAERRTPAGTTVRARAAPGLQPVDAAAQAVRRVDVAVRARSRGRSRRACRFLRESPAPNELSASRGRRQRASTRRRSPSPSRHLRQGGAAGPQEPARGSTRSASTASSPSRPSGTKSKTVPSAVAPHDLPMVDAAHEESARLRVERDALRNEVLLGEPEGEARSRDRRLQRRELPQRRAPSSGFSRTSAKSSSRSIPRSSLPVEQLVEMLRGARHVAALCLRARQDVEEPGAGRGPSPPPATGSRKHFQSLRLVALERLLARVAELLPFRRRGRGRPPSVSRRGNRETRRKRLKRASSLFPPSRTDAKRPSFGRLQTRFPGGWLRPDS